MELITALVVLLVIAGAVALVRKNKGRNAGGTDGRTQPNPKNGNPRSDD